MRWLLLFLAMFSFSSLSVAADAPSVEIPAWLDAEIQKVATRFQEWKGTDDVILFPFQTDVHSGGRDTWKHVAYVNHAAKSLPFDFVADLGDIGLDTAETKERPAAEAFLARHIALHQQYPGVSVILVGNHDHNRIAGDAKFTDPELGNACNRPSVSKAGKSAGGHEVRLTLCEANPTYGYIDLPDQKLRVFFLNTCDRDDPENYYTISPKQLQYLADNMRFSEPGWMVMTLTHFCVVPDIGAWQTCPDACAYSDAYLQILNAFNNGEKGEKYGIRWDFTENRNCRFLANLTGDSHFDSTGVRNGILFAVSQGYGGVEDKNLPAIASKLPFDTNNMLLTDIAAIKPAKHEIKIFRLGVGGETRDREFHW